MTKLLRFAATPLLLFVIGQTLLPSAEQKGAQAVSPGRYDTLRREEFLELDREVTDYFNDNYEKLDARNVTYDQQLFKSLRSIRHTTVLNQFDYRYTSDEIMRNSLGSRVNTELCQQQMRAMVALAIDFMDSVERNDATADPRDSIPLAAANFLEASGKVESGVLNGNFIWWGSYSSCVRAKIPAAAVKKYYSAREAASAGQQLPVVAGGTKVLEADIRGRYCVAHLKAKSWPQFDPYFEDRLSIKLAVCLPDSCHTVAYVESEDIRRQVDYFARFNLAAPFNSDRYEVAYLYCLPDEDSPFRQWDFGTRAFAVFVSVWCLLLVYANIKYQQRLKTMRQLRESVDIRMIINQRRQSSASSDEDDDDKVVDAGNDGIKEVNAKKKRSGGEKVVSARGGANNKIKTTPPKSLSSSPERGSGLAAPTAGHHNSLMLPGGDPSATPSPVPSDVEENDGEFNALRPIVQDGVRKNRKRAASLASQQQQQQSASGSTAAVAADDSIDFIKAFAVLSNVDFLFRTRGSEAHGGKVARGIGSTQPTGGGRFPRQSTGSGGHMRFSPEQYSVASRRTSSSNEALIKDLQQHEGLLQGGDRPKVAIVSGEASDNEATTKSAANGDISNSAAAAAAATSAAAGSNRNNKRVNIDILDGIKVVATSWIVIGHTMMFFFGLVKDLRFGDERMKDFVMAFTINTLQVVGLFYIITGTLITYLAFSRQKLKQLMRPSFWLLVVFGRYIRLIPTYFLVFWFARHVAPNLGGGPFWYDYRTDADHGRGFCATESWLTMLTMSAADVKIPLDCVPQAWYLSNDFRTLLLLPFYIVILAKNRTAGYVAILSTFVFSSAKLVNTLKEANIDYQVVLHWKPHVYALMADRLHGVYTNLSVRLSTYLLGVLVGHLLYLYETHQIKRWPSWFERYGIKVSLAIGFLFFMAAPLSSIPMINQFAPAAGEVDSDVVVKLIPLFKGAIEICMSVLLLLIVTGSGYSWLTDMFSSKLAKVLSNISYGVFLVHVEFMYKVPATKFESSYWYLFLYSIFFIAASNLIAFILYLFYEMPINNLLRVFFKKMLRTFVK